MRRSPPASLLESLLVWPGDVYELARADGRAVSCELRDSNDKLMSTGKRKQ